MEENINKDGYRENIINNYNSISVDLLAKYKMVDNMSEEEREALYNKMINELSRGNDKVKILENDYSK